MDERMHTSLDTPHAHHAPSGPICSNTASGPTSIQCSDQLHTGQLPRRCRLPDIAVSQTRSFARQPYPALLALVAHADHAQRATLFFTQNLRQHFDVTRLPNHRGQLHNIRAHSSCTLRQTLKRSLRWSTAKVVEGSDHDTVSLMRRLCHPAKDPAANLDVHGRNIRQAQFIQRSARRLRPPPPPTFRCGTNRENHRHATFDQPLCRSLPESA